MKRWWILAAVALAISPAWGSDLIAVYRRALQNDPQLKEAEATRLASLESKPQALAALLPQLSATGLVSREHDRGPTSQTQAVSLPACSDVGGQAAGIPCSPAGSTTNVLESFGFNGTIDTTTHHYTVDLKQNLFRWDNWVALKRADSQVAQAEADYQAAQQDLMQRVSQAFFDVLGAQDDVDAQAFALTSVTQQLDQAEARFKIGLIAVTDVEEARASHDSTAAALIAAKRQQASMVEALRQIIGEEPDFLATPIEPFQLADPDPVSEERWVQMALQQNLSLVSSRLAADIAQENVSASRSGHFPSLDLVGSVGRLNTDGVYTFLDNSPGGGTALDQRQRSIGIQLTFPIYSGGMVSSEVRQAVYRHRAAKEHLERIARQTEHDARDSYLGVISEISRVKALRRAAESNMTSLKATESGYQAGTRTAVDVLQARQQWVQAQTSYARSRYDYMMNVIRLQQAAGMLSEHSLERINVLLLDAPRPKAQ